MMYTMRAGVDRKLKDKIARSILYGTGVLVAAAIAIAPFTGNTTFWTGKSSNGQKDGTDTSATSSSSGSSSKAHKSSTTTSKSSGTTAVVPPMQTSVSKLGVTNSSTTAPLAATTGSGTPILSAAPVVGRGGGDTSDSGTKSTTVQDPLPDTITSPTGPAPATLPVTYCTPTTSLDPLLAVNPACVN